MKKTTFTIPKALCAFALLAGTSHAYATNDYSVSASMNDGNVPVNTLDGNLESRWSAKGVGEWIQYDLGQTQTIDSLSIAFYKGDQRSANISIELSNDGEQWENVFSGGQALSTVELQTFDIQDTDAQFIRIIGYGNSANAWNSITEVNVNTTSTDEVENLALGKTTKQSSTGYGGDSNRAVDGNTSGHWNDASVTHTNNEMQSWWEVDLDNVQNVASINIWNRTNCCSNRLSDFYILTSETPFESTDLDDTLKQESVTNYYHSETAGSPSSFEIDDNARYIRVQLATKSPLSIAEFEVIAGDNTDVGDIDNNQAKLPAAPDTTWTYCIDEGETCNFSGLKEVAYGVGNNWVYSTEIDGIDCVNNLLTDPKQGSGKSCWIREAQEDIVTVSSIDEFKSVIAKSDQQIRVKRGVYVATALMDNNTSVFQFDGSNNTFDMTGVTLQVPTKLLSTMSRTPIHSQVTYDILGSNNTFLNGTFENIYPNGQLNVTDFTEHNLDSDYWPARQMTEFRVYGDNTQFLNNTITVRGSYPYGYGDMLGKGAGSSVYLRKHAGVQVVGDNTLIDGMNLSVFAFGHGIFMQGADNTIIRNSVVQGRMRLGADMLEDGDESLMAAFNFEQQFPDYYLGEPIEADLMYNLTEDGIRAYTKGTKYDGTEVRTGAITVEDTKVINMRGCITTPLASKPSLIKNVEIQGCTIGYALANDSEVINSKGDADYGPLYHSTYDYRRNANIELTLTNNTASTGSHPMAYIAGSGHNIMFHTDDSSDAIEREIRVGDTGDRWLGDATNQEASSITIMNETNLPIVLTDTSTKITGESVGKVTDDGSSNSVN